MSVSELAEKLKQMWSACGDGDRVVTMHLFGIRYAKELGQLTGAERIEILKLADGSLTYATEFNKMINLSKYVQEK